MAERTLTVWELQHAGRAKPRWTLSGNADVRDSNVSCAARDLEVIKKTQ